MTGYGQIKFDLEIQEILDHHLDRYRSRGEPGREHCVIQSIFSRLNNLTEINNTHIRWYAVIIYLERSYRNHYLARNIPPTAFNTTLGQFIESVGRLGILTSARLPVSEAYAEKQLKQINNTLVELINIPIRVNQTNRGNDLIRLTINQAAINALKLRDFLGNKIGIRLSQTIMSEKFQTVIRQPSDRIPEEVRRSYINMNDFWNGLIP